MLDLENILKNNTYPGRGIIIGKSQNGVNAMIAYFIMGRSENSRNRVFERFAGGMRTKAFDESKISDPSLIIYNPYLAFKNKDIITNGDQTNTIYDYLQNGKTFEDALRMRCFEPDEPNFTPRISAILDYNTSNKDFTYKLSILKSGNEKGTNCKRFFYEYESQNGVGHFIHTYEKDGNPIPSFTGEPEEIAIPNTAKEFSNIIWNSLNNDNKVSLFVRTVNLKDYTNEEIIVNKNK